MSDTYYESAEGVVITRRRAVQEYEKHGLTVADLDADMGVADTYRATDVLNALGY